MSKYESHQGYYGNFETYDDIARRQGVSFLKGKTCVKVEKLNDTSWGEIVRFTLEDGSMYDLFHEQDCCESVYVESIVGDLADLVGEPLVEAEEVNNEPQPDGKDEYGDSYTWTFYKFGTRKGSVTIRWYGTSNGYYSESVSFDRYLPATE